MADLGHRILKRLADAWIGGSGAKGTPAADVIVLANVASCCGDSPVKRCHTFRVRQVEIGVFDDDGWKVAAVSGRADRGQRRCNSTNRGCSKNAW